MASNDDQVTFVKGNLSGKRLRSLMLTSGSTRLVARRLTRLVAPYAYISFLTGQDLWMPRGFPEPGTSRLEEGERLLPPHICRELTNWWMETPRREYRPGWDIAAKATIGEDRVFINYSSGEALGVQEEGIILFSGWCNKIDLEFVEYPFPRISGRGNRDKIRAAISQANAGLGGEQAGWNLSIDSHYALAWHFAWSWKIASLGIPVILVYLGFLNVDENSGMDSSLFRSAIEWSGWIRKHADGIVPNDAWDRPIDVNGTKMRAIIQSVDPYNESSSP